MPRGDGMGPFGTGPAGRRQGGCQRMGLGLGISRNNRQNRFGFAGNTPIASESLETQADRLEAQAANLRNLAKQSQRI